MDASTDPSSLERGVASEHPGADPPGDSNNVQQDQRRKSQDEPHDPDRNGSDASTVVSLAGALNGDTFDLEQFLRDVIRLYLSLISSSLEPGD